MLTAVVISKRRVSLICVFIKFVVKKIPVILPRNFVEPKRGNQQSGVVSSSS